MDSAVIASSNSIGLLQMFQSTWQCNTRYEKEGSARMFGIHMDSQFQEGIMLANWMVSVLGRLGSAASLPVQAHFCLRVWVHQLCRLVSKFEVGNGWHYFGVVWFDIAIRSHRYLIVFYSFKEQSRRIGHTAGNYEACLVTNLAWIRTGCWM